MTLPPLPETEILYGVYIDPVTEDTYDRDGFTEAQMHEYATAAVLAERAACAQIAERHSTCKNDTPNVIAIAIRAQEAE